MDCHLKVFPKSFYNKFGRIFLKHTFIWYQNNELYRRLITYEENNMVVGFLTMRKSEDSESFLRYIYPFFITAIIRNPLVFFNKDILLKIRDQFKRKDHLPEKSIELISLGIDPLFRGKGIGAKLLSEFEKITKNLGCDKIVLLVKKENSNAISFYKKNGWVKRIIDNSDYFQFIKGTIV